MTFDGFRPPRGGTAHFSKPAQRILLAGVLACTIAPSHVLLAQAPGRGNARPAVIPKSGTVQQMPALEQKMRGEFKVPEAFKATLFAGPPVAMYPACITESPDGSVFVCVDPNLSLSTMKGVGRVMRLVDTDGDGHADKYTTFAEMDSPRGVVSDGKSVYVMHPPFLTSYTDTDGDGIADVTKDIVTGLGFDLDFRGADHTTNNIQLGPDGWIYVAVGDYGFMKATGTDGKTIHHRGGSLVRVRPDGSNLEIVAEGTRNIYDISIDEFAHVYARDNTNDGDGWDTRLHYLAPGARMGYPSRYQNFKSEHFPTLHDYGGGAGVGSFWIQDPAWPEGFNNTLFTGDWTTQRIYRHTLGPSGAIYTITQDEFISLLRPADITMDGNSNLYVSSLAGGQFNYTNDSVGYVVQVRPANLASSPETPVFGESDANLLKALASGSALRRLHAQQELLRRGEKAPTVKSLRQTIANKAATIDARVAAIFTLKQLSGAKSNDALIAAAKDADPRVREVALRSLADRLDQLKGMSSALFVKALGDPDAQVKVEAIRGLVRLGARDAAPSLVALTDTTDQAIAHLAINALETLGATSAALKGLDGTPAVRRGSLRALAMMRDSMAVKGLVERLGKTTDPMMRAELVHTLGRAYNREAEWKGDWWTTRPQHVGPYFDPAPWEESPRIRTALVNALTAANGDELNALTADLVLNQALPRGAQPILVAATTTRDPLRARLIDAMIGHAMADEGTMSVAAQLDKSSTSMRGPVAQLLAGESVLGTAALPLARSIVMDPATEPAPRAALLTAIGQVPGQAGLDVAAPVFAMLTPAASAAGTMPASPVEAAWRRFVGDRRRSGELDYFITMTKASDASQRALAYSVLLQSVRAPRTPPQVRDKVAPVLDAAWADPMAAASLVQAIGVMRLEASYTDKLAMYNATKPK